MASLFSVTYRHTCDTAFTDVTPGQDRVEFLKDDLRKEYARTRLEGTIVEEETVNFGGHQMCCALQRQALGEVVLSI